MFYFYDRLLFYITLVSLIAFFGGMIYAGQKLETIPSVRSGCTLEKGEQENGHPSKRRASVFTRHAQINT